MRKLGHGITIERAVIEDAACRFEPTFAIYKRIVDAVCYADAKMANLVIELPTVDFADDAYKNSNFHFCSPFQAFQRLLMSEDIMSSILPRHRITKIEQFIDIFPRQDRGRNALFVLVALVVVARTLDERNAQDGVNCSYDNLYSLVNLCAEAEAPYLR